MAQVNVAVPCVVYPLLGVHNSFLKGSHRGCRPEADQAGFALRHRTPHLHRERDDLGEQNSRQHDEVLIAAENCVHTNAGTSSPDNLPFSSWAEVRLAGEPESKEPHSAPTPPLVSRSK